MNRIFILLVVSMLILSGCRQINDASESGFSEGKEGQTFMIQTESASEPNQSEKQSETLSSVESNVSEQLSSQINSALLLVPGSERLLESQEGLFLLKEYGFEMKWMEANQIEHLDRGTSVVDGETYFLLIPKYVGSSVEVQRLEWNGTEFAPVEILYKNESTPDSYGLVLTSNEPEASLNLRVTVTHGNEHSSRTFSYDGVGGRPAVLVFPGDEEWMKNIPKTKLFQSRAGNRTIQMEIPEEWEIIESEKELPRIVVALLPEGKLVSYHIWLVDTADISPKEYLDSINEGFYGDFSLKDGRICHYIKSTDSPASYTYALEEDGLTVVLMAQFIEDIPDSLPEGGYRSMLRPPHEAIPEFIRSLRSIHMIE